MNYRLLTLRFRLFLQKRKGNEVPDIINLLPDNIANQIAAGEVIQRPASAVKELLENAIDAGATEIRLFVNDAGKSLIQVIDNGKGMSETDARMCFERHATSKINDIDDLFRIKTMGFRGEALASIAGVSQVSLKTRKRGEPVGTAIEIENSVVKEQKPAATAEGTSIAMKNLFFNVPARRNFLKSNTSELRHIIDEFTRVALAFPEIFFSLTTNGQELYHLSPGSLKHRIIKLLGNQYESKLVSVKEETDYMNILGFVGKPETAKKTRGDQYFFVNNRFIKSAYLNHAVNNAFAEMISKDSFPMYVLFIDIDPSRVDINVHPTKQEIKFEDEKVIYAFVNAAVRHALAQFSVTPALDFELDSSVQQQEAIRSPFTPEKQSAAMKGSLYKTFTQKNQAHFIESKSNLPGIDLSEKEWEGVNISTTDPVRQILPQPLVNDKKPVNKDWIQMHNSFILVEFSNGFGIIHQQHAHERILFEKINKALRENPIAVQKSLFPEVVVLSQQDAMLLNELLPDLALLGFQIEPFGNDSFVIHGKPAHILKGNEKESIEKLVEDYKHFNTNPGYSAREKLVRALVLQQSIKAGTPLETEEIKALVNDLFECEITNTSPTGRPVFLEFKKEELDKMFGR